MSRIVDAVADRVRRERSAVSDRAYSDAGNAMKDQLL
jgi:hypothetical protein